MNKKNKILVVIAVVLICLMAAMLVINGQSSTAGDKSITVKVVHLQGDAKTFKYKTDEEYLGKYLLSEGLIAGEDGPYGLMVNTVDKETANASKEQWWGYTVNGKMSNYGVDTQPISDGDVYEFTLNEGYDSFN